jgi:hypothetical protein
LDRSVNVNYFIQMGMRIDESQDEFLCSIEDKTWPIMPKDEVRVKIFRDLVNSGISISVSAPCHIF